MTPDRHFLHCGTASAAPLTAADVTAVQISVREVQTESHCRMAAGVPFTVLNKAALGIVRQNIADRCPSESETDVVFSIFNDGHDPAPVLSAAPLCIPYCVCVHVQHALCQYIRQ